MKKNQVNAILVKQAKRRNAVFALISIIVIVSFVALSFFVVYFKKSKKQYVSYDETSNINYKVYLKDNEFFKDSYLDKNNRYIASLIDYIDADFNYELSLKEKDVEYKYSYRVEANIDVKEKNSDNPIYQESKILLKSNEKTTSLNQISINQNIDIDYNYYNNLIKKMINFYTLDDIESYLTIVMYIDVVGSCEEFEENNNQESTMSLIIPLTTKTVGIDISNNLIDNQNNIIKCKSFDSINYIFIIIAIIFSIGDLILIIYTIRYIFKTRTAENIYERELKKILNNYSSYIQTIDNDCEFGNYQLLKINTFTDMLEIRDTIKQPILMKENNDKTGAYFVIPSNTKILYVYRLKVSDIEKKIQKFNRKGF